MGMDETSPGRGDSPPRFSVIVPARDEEATIGRVVAGIRAQLGEGDEILVVDDGSTDRTAEEAGRCGARVVSHPYNIGNGAAIKTGIRQARGEILVFLDGDGQHDPADIPALLEHTGRYDLVVGARTLSGRGLPHRNLANACYNILASYITGRRIPDLTSGFRAVRSRVARRFAYLLPNTFSYPATLTLALLRTGHSVRHVPIRVQRPPFPDHHLPHRRSLFAAARLPPGEPGRLPRRSPLLRPHLPGLPPLHQFLPAPPGLQRPLLPPRADL
jgi:glycosyltransferase involved in cell wall biosynthesis